ncbi:MAG: rod shape-determining protein MreC [Bacteroidaceae bacterium]
MGELTNRIIKNIHWGIFLLLEILSGWLLFRFNTYQGSVWFTQANTVVARVMEWEEEILSYIHLAKQNKYLTRQNVVLQYNMSIMRSQLDSLRHVPSFTEQEEAKVTEGMHLIPAKVVTNSIHRKDNYLTINVGKKDGVRPEMGVVSGTGVVGIVYRVTDHYALVMSVLNSQSNISCRLRDTGYFGYLKWSGGNPLHASMDDVPRHAQIRKGDIVETSGFSNMFPPGLFLGRVAQINNSPDGMAYRLEVQMSTDLSNIRDVCVIEYENHAELDSLEIRQQRE